MPLYLLRQVQTAHGKIGGLDVDAAVVQESYLNHVLGQVGSLLVDFGYSNEALQEGGERDEVDVEVEDSEHALLHLDYLFLVVGIVTDMNVVFDQWWPYLFVLAGNQHGWYTNELQILLGNFDFLQVSVYQVDGQEQTFNFEFELEMHFDDPIDQNAPHPFCYMVLVVHILDLRLIVLLSIHEVFHYILSKLADVLHILCSLLVAVLNRLHQM